MGKLFNPDSPFFRTMNHLTDLIVLNLLAVLCSLPVITIGAAWSALYDAVGKLQKDEGHIYRSFFEAFKSNFKKATIIWVIFAVLGACIAISAFFYLFAMEKPPIAMTILLYLCIFIWTMAISWVFPLQAKFENTIHNTIFNSILCGIAYLPRTILMGLLNLIPMVLLLMAPLLFLQIGVVFILIYFSAAADISLRLLRKPYAILTKKPEDEEESESSEE